MALPAQPQHKHGAPLMNKHDRRLAAAIVIWLVVAALAFLGAASLRGYDDSLCRSYGGTCEWYA